MTGIHGLLNLQNIRNQTRNTAAIRRHAERIASGASDNSGLLNARIRELAVSGRSAGLTNSLISGIEESASTTEGLLLRARELTVAASNDTLDESSRATMYNEIESIFAEIDRISAGANFRAIPFLTDSESVYVQTGPNSYDRVGVTFEELSTESLGLESFTYLLQNSAESGVLIDSSAATSLINRIDAASIIVNNYRGSLGAVQNSLRFREEGIGLDRQNLTEANSRLSDADTALEIMQLLQELAMRDVVSFIYSSANNINQGNVLRLLNI